MKKSIAISIFVFAASVISTFAQSNQLQPVPTPSRVIVTNTMPPVQPVRTPIPYPKPSQTPIVVGSAPQTGTTNPYVPPANPYVPPANSQASNLSYKSLSFAQIKSKIAEAKRYLNGRPLTIASVEAVNPTTLIRVAFYDENTHQIDSYVLTKDQFLSSGTGTGVLTANGKQMISRTIRGNGVNTPITVTDMNGHAHLPLVVQYPREARGVMQEMAYYVSTHPGLVTPEVVSAGRYYVHNIVDIARERLRASGYFIQPKIADVGERLATVEHVDQLRFRTEPQPNIYNDIFTLYALNEGETYRYSVSVAGAGGMVQMIPSTYRMIRSRYPNAALMPDFVEGMRNHVNAAQAMLLYIQLTWNDLQTNPTITNAMASGLASQEHLLAAGYNSNPAKLASYINRGGTSWTVLIPRETQIYLQVWDSLERSVPLIPRKQ